MVALDRVGLAQYPNSSSPTAPPSSLYPSIGEPTFKLGISRVNVEDYPASISTPIPLSLLLSLISYNYSFPPPSSKLWDAFRFWCVVVCCDKLGCYGVGRTVAGVKSGDPRAGFSEVGEAVMRLGWTGNVE